MVNVTIKEAMNWAKNEADNRQPFLTDDIAFLIGERLDLNPSQLKMKQDYVLSDSELAQIKSDYEALKAGQSPQYILGYAWFFGYKLKVNENVLIPRFDTEDLVAWVRDDLIETGSQKSILDIGTGSGAITVALANELNSRNLADLIELSASDISEAALTVAKDNFAAFNLNVQTHLADILTGLDKYDVIISNPPYIKTTEVDLMDESVVNNEPDLALFAGADGLDFYREFAEQVDEHLNENGSFYLEFGIYQKEDLAELFAQKLPNYEIEFRNDLANHPRMVRGRKKK